MRSERKKNWNFGEAQVFPVKLFIMLLKVDLSFVFVCELIECDPPENCLLVG